ncbi:hypothetical protein PIB30_025157 [Stylosanthes scabra]|uniref:Uncharacterized protein n=1 Tax=Stylosanthes scabra TaxID=79078 RepID=A0ABU6Y7B4_9FABA|nr:hypothetical protein [Stylosanthes scabra]
MNPKSTSISERTLPSESVHSTFGSSSKEVSSQSKESTNSKKTKVVPSTPYVPIRPGTNRGIQIDPRVQFQERLEEARAKNVERVKKSVRPLPSIPVIDMEADDELDDLLKVISETKAGSEHVVSNSENKFVQQSIQPQIQQPSQPEKEVSSIQQARNASMQKTILRKIFENLFHSRENLSNLRLKAALVKENCEALATAETSLKEKNSLYEKHLKEASVLLDDLSIERNALVKKLAEIQAQIQEIDNKSSKIKKPLDKIQEKKLEIQDKLSDVKESQKLNEVDLKKIQEEDDQETKFFRNMCEEDSAQRDSRNFLERNRGLNF